MDMKAFSTEPWVGSSKLIIGIDLGTTHSAVSFAHLFNGGRQYVQRVSKWPGQEAHQGDSKIPTLVYYDQENKAVCFGAEAIKPENQDRAEDEGWSLAKHFKLHLHPHSMRANDQLALYALPFGVSLATIYADFIGYLLKHTQAYFEERILDGEEIWKKCSSNMLVVLAHPNGWSTREQCFMRQALRSLGSVYKTCPVTFVTEGEASVHFCMFHSNMDSALEPDTDLIVCDAGGSTIDTTAYHVVKTQPLLELKETKASACIQSGGVFVDLECERYITNLLADADLEEEDMKEYVSAAVKDFESTMKKEFESPETTLYLGFRDNSFSKPELGIKRGRMSLSGVVVKTFFSKVVSSTIHSVKQQMSGLDPKHLLLVGGFGESRYLRKRLTTEFSQNGCQVTVIEDSTSKAAADGAVTWAAKLAVVGRATRAAYGTIVRSRYDPADPQHQGRKVTRGHAGYDGVVGRWSEIIGEGVVLSGNGSARRKFLKSYKPGLSSYSDLDKYTDEIWVYHGEAGTNPGWVFDKNAKPNPGFEKLCRVEANLGGMRKALIKKQGADGTYEVLEFYLAIELGGTELCARIEWIEDGKPRSGPVSILPEPIDLPPVGINMSD